MSRLAAVIAADLRIRFRRPSTLIIFLLLSGIAYLWVPDPATGMTLINVDGQRAIYNSAAIGVGTASLATIFIGLVGFYVISNAIRRDVDSRCGFVIASTTMRGSEYLAGKFAGNVIFLATFMAGFMIASMAMLLVRGEAALEPLVFIWQYALLVPPVIMFVSGVAIVFESVPLLRGKFGDVAYFFFWATTLGFVASHIKDSSGPGLAGYFDFTGFGFMLDTMRHSLNTTHLSLGHTSFDPKKGLFVFQGLQLRPEWVMPRIFATIAPIVLLLVARPFFHRFDPARVKQGGPKASRNWLHRIVNSKRMIPIAAIVLAVLPLSAMPIAFAVAAVLIADVSCREKRAGTIALVFAAPGLKERFVWWKLKSTAITAFLLLFIPCVRMIVQRPGAAPYLITGILFVVAFATLLGIVSANPKTFLVLFLTFWYVVVNDGGKTRALDFAGFSGIATPAVLASYLTLAIIAMLVAELFHRADLRRNW